MTPLYALPFRVFRRFVVYLFRLRFRRCGRNVLFDPFSRFTYHTISVGDDVYIGSQAIFLAPRSFIDIGNKVMFGPRVMVLAGNHNTETIGRYMFDVKDKRPEHDLPVCFEDDIWIGAGAIILQGVTIGRGSIVGAGAVVPASIPPYSVAVGNPARVIKRRWTDAEIQRHEAMLGSSASGSLT